jgi:hypothetical protein
MPPPPPPPQVAEAVGSRRTAITRRDRERSQRDLIVGRNIEDSNPKSTQESRIPVQGWDEVLSKILGCEALQSVFNAGLAGLGSAGDNWIYGLAV